MKLIQQLGNGTEKPPLVRGTIPIAMSLLLIWLLRDTIAQVDFAAVMVAASLFSPAQWIGAGVLTVISFSAVAQYDRLAAAWMGLTLPRSMVVHAGWRATAIGQVLGYGLVTGSLTRWRALGRPCGLSLWDCTQLTMGVTISFFAGWAVVTSLAVLLAPFDTFPHWATALALSVVAVTCLILTLSFAPPAKWVNHLPGPVFLLPIIGFAAVDTLAAAGILYLFLPAAELSFLTLYAAFLVALFAGMISGLPGGLGAFELTFVALVSPENAAEPLSAILAFRVIYYAVPAVLAGLSLIWVRNTTDTASLRPDTLSADRQLADALANAAPPEADLTCQGPLLALTRHDLTGGALWHRARNCDFVLGDPFGPASKAAMLIQMRDRARSAARGLALYKCSAVTAQIAQEQGMRTVKIGSEAVINVQKFKTEGSCFRQLRRKLRTAEKAKITVTEDRPRYADLAAIDAEWQRRSRPARGFSMGYLSPRLIARQRVFIAIDQGQPIAFITLLTGPEKWTLDIIRTKSRCPDGTVHALVMAAIDAAKNDGIPTLSLAAAPFKLNTPASTLSERLVQFLFNKSTDCQGLAQFKTSFAPDWHPRYLAVSSLITLPYAVLDLWQLIHAGTGTEQHAGSGPHNDYGDYEIESYLQPCHALQRMKVKE